MSLFAADDITPAALASSPEFEHARDRETARVNRRWVENQWTHPKFGGQVQDTLFELDEAEPAVDEIGQASFF